MYVKKSLILLTVIIAVLGCTKKRVEVEPVNLTGSEQLVLVTANYGRPDASLTALDGRTGKVKWKMAFDGDIIVHSKVLYLNRRVWTDIVNYADTVSFYANSGGPQNLLTIDAATGKVIRQIKNTLRPDFTIGCCSTYQFNSLVKIEDEIAYMVLSEYDFGIAYRETIYATDLAAGQVKWKYKVPSEKLPLDVYSRNGITVTDGKVFVAGRNQSFVLDASTGHSIQEYKMGGLINPVEGCYYLTKSYEASSIDAKSGNVKWRFGIPAGDGAITSTPLLVYNDLAYVCTMSGSISALDKGTGEKKWTFKVKEITPYSNYKVSMRSGMLYAYNESLENNRLFSLDPITGKLNWEVLMDDNSDNISQQVGDENELVYERTMSSVTAVDSKTGKKVWRRLNPKGEVINNIHAYNRAQLDF
ncbi:PQQ-binding-like beta-propeller repeat protein [Dyadobacter aurulentus]|uniref:PQQ-binding-like beta-propeller repeat protein n=1 Tax=Dyadobacter sp. UC 10 TaxID=2605428 RepID=UPI0011F37F86|nr:PQQ-binding-like beta-propeller repeat protein [Dyadobacter sp. UC 10]KAA0990151.1 PQQ-binding-like beta-propeller repeat protein [Dyadobacter sp. UC 10]